MNNGLISNPQGAYGTTDLVEKFQPLVMEMVATADIAARTVVTVNTVLKVTKATTGAAAAGNSLGVTVDAIKSGRVGKVVVFGPVDNVPSTGAITAGQPVVADTTTAGNVKAKANPAVGECIGFALTDAASNLVSIFVGRGLSGGGALIPTAAPTALTAASGVTGTTVNDAGGSYDQTTTNNNNKVLADAINSLRTALIAAGVLT